MNTPKHLIFGREAGEKLAAGILKLADAVAPTLGPKGCNVGLQTWNSSKITNDGFTIVKDFVLSDQYENMGAEMAREVASKIKEMSGDGTTTGIILLSSIVNEGLKNLSSGISVRKINEGIRLAVEALNKKIVKSSTQIKDNSQIKSIAMAAASGSESIATVIAEAFEKIGQTGFVSVEAGSSMETTVEIVNGLQIKKGYAGAYFVTDTEKMLTVMNNPYVLITDKKISSVQEILPILQSFASTGKELVIFCDDMDNDVLSTLVVNKLKGVLKVAVVKAPGFGEQKVDNLEDIAIFTGSSLISENIGATLKNVTLDSLGHCERVEISSSTTKLIGSHCLKEVLSMRLRQFDVAMEEHPENKQQLLLRKTRLEGKVAVIKVGASSEIELQQKKQVFEDSVNATRLAIESGFVVGGGLSLFKASQALQDLVSQQKDHAVAVGIRSVIKACEAPLRRLIRNSGLEDSVVLNEINNTADEDIGFNMNSGNLENLKQSGILDPTLVITNIVTHASSMAQVILMSEVLIGDDKDDD